MTALFRSAAAAPDPISDLLDDGEPKPLSATRWTVPTTVELDRSSMHLVWHSDGGRERWVKPGPKMLERFIGLRSAPPDRILAYARAWGLLEICRHGLPRSHNPTRELDADEVVLGCERLVELVEDEWEFREPIEAWHRFAEEAHATALLAASIRGYGPTPDPFRGRRAAIRLGLRWRLNRWLELGAVRPAIVLHPNWLEDEWESPLLPVVGGSGLFGALALRLALACTGAVGLAPCAACGEWFTPNFAPREGQRAWCPEAKCQKAERAAPSRSYRRRNIANSEARN